MKRVAIEVRGLTNMLGVQNRLELGVGVVSRYIGVNVKIPPYK